MARCLFVILFVLTIYPVYQVESWHGNFEHTMLVLYDTVMGIDDDK